MKDSIDISISEILKSKKKIADSVIDNKTMRDLLKGNIA